MAESGYISCKDYIEMAHYHNCGMEEAKMNVPRMLSCRGVAFEIQTQKTSLFALPQQPVEGHQPNEGWFRRPWTSGSFFKVFPSSHSNNTMSQISIHISDLQDDDNEEDYFSLAAHSENGNQHKLELVVEAVGAENPLPKPVPMKDSRLSIILFDQGLFTVYKRLFVVSFTLNVVGLMLAATGNFPYGKRNAALFSIGNILALTLCRSEASLRVIFWLTVKLLGRPWIPLWIKTATTAFLQSLGGIHSGCGVSSIIWLAYALILTIIDRENTTPEIIGIASAIFILTFLSSLAAFPLVRHLHHNVFERMHRFAGWTALILVWFFVILSKCYDTIRKEYDLSFFRLFNQQEFWFTLIITIVIVFPWLSIRRVPVEVSAPSDHASLIKFKGGIQAGILGRISPSPLSEWHAFGIISDGKKGHMMLAGAVGDFTKSLVANPPSHLWLRTVHFAGLPYLVNLYQRVVLVATGSGICVFLSFLLQTCSADVCVVWVAKGIEQNFGKEIKEMMSGHPKDKVIVHDTAILGRPNVAEMSVDAAKRWNAEVVIVTSNPEGSRDVVKACKAAGIAAFGPIWDS